MEIERLKQIDIPPKANPHKAGKGCMKLPRHLEVKLQLVTQQVHRLYSIPPEAARSFA